MMGNVVAGFTANCYLQLDCDVIRLTKLTKWSKEYTTEMDVGSVLIGLTSINPQLTILGKRLPNNYLAVFGKRISSQEILIHVENAYLAGIVNKQFRDVARVRKGMITERVNSKNYAIPPPKIIKYIPNGDNEGCMKYLFHWKWNKKVGIPYENGNE